jgi:AcrR family transcriptional regulator
MAQNKTKKLAQSAKGSDSYHHGDLRATLLAAAIKMLKNKDANELSLRELAREAGVSIAAPYRHFKNKQELIAAIMTEGFELQSKYMRESAEENKNDILKMYYGCGLSYFKMGKSHPQHFKLMFGPELIPNEDYPELQLAACSTFALLKNMVIKCQEAKLIGEGDPYNKALNCWTMVHGFTVLYAEGRLNWLGVNKENSEKAFLTLMSQFLVGNQQPLAKSDYGFSTFGTKESILNREMMDKL